MMKYFRINIFFTALSIFAVGAAFSTIAAPPPPGPYRSIEGDFVRVEQPPPLPLGHSDRQAPAWRWQVFPPQHRGDSGAQPRHYYPSDQTDGYRYAPPGGHR